MDPAYERMFVRATELILIALFIYLAEHVHDSLPYCTGAMGTILGARTGAGIADRVKERTLRKMASYHPPPGPPPGGPGTPVFSHAPPPSGRAEGPPPGAFKSIAATLLIAGAMAFACTRGGPTARDTAFGVEAESCVPIAKAAERRDAGAGWPTYDACRASVRARYGLPTDAGGAE